MDHMPQLVIDFQQFWLYESTKVMARVNTN